MFKISLQDHPYTNHTNRNPHVKTHQCKRHYSRPKGLPLASTYTYIKKDKRVYQFTQRNIVEGEGHIRIESCRMVCCEFPMSCKYLLDNLQSILSTTTQRRAESYRIISWAGGGEGLGLLRRRVPCWVTLYVPGLLCMPAASVGSA